MNQERCPKCKETFKYEEVEIFGVKKRFRYDCKCERDRLEAIEREKKIQEIKASLSSSNIPRRFDHFTLKNVRQDAHNMVAYKACQEILTSFPGYQTVTLIGRVGTGKTTLAAATLRSVIIRHGCKGYFGTPSEILGEIRKTYSDDVAEIPVINRFIHVPIMVIDDLGKESHTDWAQERLFHIINGRWSNRRVTIITVRIREDEEPCDAPDILEKRYPNTGEDIVSRLQEGQWITLRGEDRRKASWKSKTASKA